MSHYEHTVHPLQAPAAIPELPEQPSHRSDGNHAREINNINIMRHAYKILSDEEKAKMVAIKDKGLEFYNMLQSFGSSRELSLAATKIEEAVMWAVKDITK